MSETTLHLEYNGDVCDWTVTCAAITCACENGGVVRISYYTYLTREECAQIDKAQIKQGINSLTEDDLFPITVNQCDPTFMTNGTPSPINNLASVCGYVSLIDSNGLKELMYRMGQRDRWEAFIEKNPDFGGFVRAHFTPSAKIPYATNDTTLYNSISFSYKGENVYVTETFARANNMDDSEQGFYVDCTSDRNDFHNTGNTTSQYWSNSTYCGNGANDNRAIITTSTPIGAQAGWFNPSGDNCVYGNGENGQLFNQLNSTSDFNTGSTTWESIRIGNGMIAFVLADQIQPFNNVFPHWEVYADGEGSTMDLTLVLTNWASIQRKYPRAIIKTWKVVSPDNSISEKNTGIANGKIYTSAQQFVNDLPLVRTNSFNFSDYSLFEGILSNTSFSFIMLCIMDGDTQLTQQCVSFISNNPSNTDGWAGANNSYCGKNYSKVNEISDASTIKNVLGLFEEDKYEDKNEESDDITDSEGYSTTGLLTETHALTQGRINQFGGVLWGKGMFEKFELINNSPIENVVSCKAFPFNIDGAEEEIVCGNVAMGVNGKLVASNWDGFKRDIGEIKVTGYYNSFLDFEPFTKLAIFLPFIGFKMLDCSLFMNKMLKVRYIVDLVTGTCKAILFADGVPVNSFDGQIGIDIPVTSSNRAQVEAGYISSFIDTVGQVASFNPATQTTYAKPPKNPGTTSMTTAGAVGAVANVTGGIWDAIASNQFHAQTGGGISPSCMAYETRDVYLIYDRPTYQDISGFAHTYGRLCRLTRRIGGLKGFTKTSIDIDLSGIPCTDIEREEIRNILSTGFYA